MNGRLVAQPLFSINICTYLCRMDCISIIVIDLGVGERYGGSIDETLV